MEKVNEQWKPIKGFEGLYEVSDLGRVKSVSRVIARGDVRQTVNERILSPKLSKKGYLIVGLHRNGSSLYRYIHRLVGDAFLERPDCECEINHINEDKMDNRVENLEWCTHTANVNHGTGRCRHDRAVARPCSCYTENGQYIRSYVSITEAARELGVGKSSILAAIVGKSATCKGMIWTYA